MSTSKEGNLQQQMDSSMKPRIVKNKFTPKEDALIRELVEKASTITWPSIAAHLENRTGRQVRERWVNYLSPNMKSHPWTEEEDEQLKRLFNTVGPKWSAISQLIPGRTDVSLKNRYQLLKRRMVKQQKREMIIQLQTQEMEQFQQDKHQDQEHYLNQKPNQNQNDATKKHYHRPNSLIADEIVHFPRQPPIRHILLPLEKYHHNSLSLSLLDNFNCLPISTRYL